MIKSMYDKLTSCLLTDTKFSNIPKCAREKRSRVRTFLIFLLPSDLGAGAMSGNNFANPFIVGYMVQRMHFSDVAQATNTRTVTEYLIRLLTTSFYH